MAAFAGNLRMSTRELKAGRRMRKLDISTASPALSMRFRHQPGRSPGGNKEKQEYQQPFQIAVPPPPHH